MKVLIAVLIIVAGGLFVTNPEKSDFITYIDEHVNDAITDGTDSRFGQLLGDLGGSIAGGVAKTMGQRKNYGLFSLYEFDIDDDRRDNQKWQYIGIAGQIWELNKDE